MAAPLNPVAIPAQLTALLTVMFKVPMATVPAENSGKLVLLVKATVEAVNAELADQLVVVVSHVPLVAADAPLLSHHKLVVAAPTFPAKSAKDTPVHSKTGL